MTGKCVFKMTSYNLHIQLIVKVGKSVLKYNSISTLVSPIYTFSLAGNINVYTPSQCTNMEKYSKHVKYKGKNADYGGN